MNWLLPLPVLLPLISAGVTLMLGRYYRLQSTIAFSTLLVSLAAGIGIAFASDTQPLVLDVGSWAAPLGISLVADRLTALMLLTSLTVMVAVLWYALSEGTAYESHDMPVPIFHPTYLILCAGVNNAFLTGDMFNLYVGIEILLAASFVLITLGGTRDRIRSGTVYVIVSLVGSAIFLVGLAALYGATGTMNMAQLSIRLAEIDPHTAVLLQAILLVSFGLKAAVFPLSAWLPDSYPTAPAPITAVFAGLLTKVGIYAIIRVQVLLFPPSSADTILGIAGILTMLVGILGAVAQDDVKRLLSFTLVSHIGFMLWGISLSSTMGIAAAIFYAVHHILVQTTLFLVTGVIEKLGGSTSLRKLHSLQKLSVPLIIWYLIPGLNLVGFPPLTGFLGKLGLAQASVIANSALGWALLAAGMITSLLTLYVVIKVWIMAFWQERDSTKSQLSQAEETLDTHQDPHRLPIGVWLSSGVLIVVTILMALGAQPLFAFVSRAAVTLQTDSYIAAVLSENGRGSGTSNDEITSTPEPTAPASTGSSSESATDSQTQSGTSETSTSWSSPQSSLSSSQTAQLPTPSVKSSDEYVTGNSSSGTSGSSRSSDSDEANYANLLDSLETPDQMGSSDE